LGRGGGGGTGGYAAASAGADGGDGAKPLWEAHKSPEGYTYYYNTIDGSTTWDMPADYDGKS
jgi:far upstream element-binding protein